MKMNSKNIGDDSEYDKQIKIEEGDSIKRKDIGQYSAKVKFSKFNFLECECIQTKHSSFVHFCKKLNLKKCLSCDPIQCQHFFVDSYRLAQT